MPAIVSSWFEDLKVPSRKESAAYAYLIEVLEIISGLIFIAGSVCFLPRYSKNVEVFIAGCHCFVLGSVFYVMISCGTLIEALNEKGTWTFEALQNVGWVIGSIIFLIGAILYFPDAQRCDALSTHGTDDGSSEVCASVAQHVNKNDKEFIGTVLFILGSSIFVLAVFLNSLNQRRFSDWHHGMMVAVLFGYMIGSLLYCMGSVAFLPNVGCGPEMVAVGAWMFIVGSVFYTVSAILNLSRTHYMLKDDGMDEAESPLAKGAADEGKAVA